MPKIKRCEINDKGILSGIRGAAQFLASALEFGTNATATGKTIWTAVAKRSGDTAFERARDLALPATIRACESGVALTLPAAVHDSADSRMTGARTRHFPDTVTLRQNGNRCGQEVVFVGGTVSPIDAACNPAGTY
jgi:hypothetical protein